MPTGNKELKKPTKEKISMEIATKKGDAGVAVKSSNTKTAIKTPASKPSSSVTLTKQERRKVFKEEKANLEERKKARKEEKAAAVCKTIEEAGFTAVVRAYQPSVVRKMINMYIKGGLKVIEVSTSCPQYAKTIKELRTNRPEVTVGVGHCQTVAQCKSAVAAGAQFVVADKFDESVVKAAAKLHTPIMPGCATPSEMKRAHELGCTMQKLFAECAMPVILQSVGRSAPPCTPCICEEPPAAPEPAAEPEVEAAPEPKAEKPKKPAKKKVKKPKKVYDYDSGGEEE